MDNVAVVVASFDGYKDVWPAFVAAKKKNWPDCPYKTYMISNFDFVDSIEIEPICTGEEINWCDRMEKALKKIPEETFILLLEDYLIGNKVQTRIVQKYMDLFKKNQMKYLRLINIPKANCKSNSPVVPISDNMEYGINLQPAVWSKKYFMSLLQTTGGKRSAWDFEVSLLKEAQKGENCLKEGCYTTETNLLNIHNGVLKGKWFPNEVKFFRERGIDINTDTRQILSNKEVLEYQVRLLLREMMSPSMRKILKRVLKKWGYKFASDE